MNWTETTKDLGIIKVKSVNKVKFSFTPDPDIVIKNTSGSCSCTVSSTKSDHILITYTARKDIPPKLKEQGIHQLEATKTVHIIWNTLQDPTLHYDTLTIKATLVERIPK